MNLRWAGLAALVVAEIGYPLVDGATRARLTVLTVLLGFAVSVAHAAASRGRRTAVALVAVTAGGGLTVEALGVATGVPFGTYSYGDALGFTLFGVPLVIPLAWTWMAWPAWLAAGRLVAPVPLRVPLAGLALATWDLFLDPQMVAEGYWRWRDPRPALPGVPGIPLTNYLGWLLVAVILMALLAAVLALLAAAAGTRRPGVDAPMYVLYLWTYASGVLAHAVFLDLPASAAWGALGMGSVAVPLAVALWRGRSRPPRHPAARSEPHRVAT
ncbi:carotenoid biosynthesis protein [Planosporangium sp. 12N6]|uniref:carotenoid biosynthesis protein n=1 Tax=Planosporangium spinosum TaxID=3402278 RepID=UPI003CEA03D0